MLCLKKFYRLFFLAACVAAGPFAVFACPIAYAIASGVTEGKNVKDIQAAFDAGVQQIKVLRTTISSIGKKTRQLVSRVKADKDRLVNVQSQLDVANREGRLTLKHYTMFFKRYHSTVIELYNQCNDYLQADKKTLLLR